MESSSEEDIVRSRNGEQHIILNSFYFAYVIPDAECPPSEEETFQIVEGTRAHLEKRFHLGCSTRSNWKFLRLELELDQIRFNAGIPQRKYNMCAQYKSARVVFSKESTDLPNRARCFRVFQNAVQTSYLVNYVQPIPIFASTEQVYFAQDESIRPNSPLRLE